MSVILLVDGLHELYAGTAGGGQVTAYDQVLAAVSPETRRDYLDLVQA
jgi:hypothetical protein